MAPFPLKARPYYDMCRKCDSLEAQLSRLREMARKTSEAIPKQVPFRVSFFRFTVAELLDRQVMKCLFLRTRCVPPMSQFQGLTTVMRFIAATLACLIARGHH